MASAQGRRGEVANQELAGELAANQDRQGIRELAGNLGHKDKNVAGDCVKVMGEMSVAQSARVGKVVRAVALVKGVDHR